MITNDQLKVSRHINDKLMQILAVAKKSGLPVTDDIEIALLSCRNFEYEYEVQGNIHVL